VPIEVFVADEQSDRPVEVARFGALAERVLNDRRLGSDVELNVLFVDEGSIASLNERFLGHKGPTDVLSFPIEDELSFRPGPPGTMPGGNGPGRSDDETAPPLMLGDIVICPEVAARNAPGHAGTYEAELAHLVVHGILHLCGMDHEDEAEATEMEALESELLSRHFDGAGP
jgi:probable rRNA maturation factor